MLQIRSVENLHCHDSDKYLQSLTHSHDPEQTNRSSYYSVQDANNIVEHDQQPEDAKIVEHGQQPESIASHVAKTLRTFRTLESALSKFARFDSVLKGATVNDFAHRIENDFTRFKMWVGNQAAHQIGSASLDYRLSEAAHLQQQVIYLLKDMCESLQTATSLVHDDPSSLEKKQKDREDVNSQDSDSHFSSSGSDENDEPDVCDEGPNLSLETLSTDIGEAVDCLLRLSVAVANPAPLERFRKFVAGPSEDISFHERNDIEHVRNKFPSITHELAEVLGKFITRRRQFFKYRKAYHEKLASGMEPVLSEKETETSHTELTSQTVASSLPEKYKTPANSNPATSLVDEDARSDAGMSQTSYASSASLTFAGTDQEASTLRVPSWPSSEEDGIFECPYCYRMIAAKTRTAWKRHVFEDLRPYTCILPNCIESNLDFDHRRHWQLHVLKYHWRSWSCLFKCQEAFSTEAELSRHIRDHHLPTGTEEELKSIAALGEGAAPNDASSPCPLCRHPVKGLERYIKHVGWHLEQLALFGLPKLEGEIPIDESGSNKQSNAGSEDEVFEVFEGPPPQSSFPSRASRTHQLSSRTEDEVDNWQHFFPSLPNLMPEQSPETDLLGDIGETVSISHIGDPLGRLSFSERARGEHFDSYGLWDQNSQDLRTRSHFDTQSQHSNQDDIAPSPCVACTKKMAKLRANDEKSMAKIDACNYQPNQGAKACSACDKGGRRCIWIEKSALQDDALKVRLAFQRIKKYGGHYTREEKLVCKAVLDEISEKYLAGSSSKKR